MRTQQAEGRYIQPGVARIRREVGNTPLVRVRMVVVVGIRMVAVNIRTAGKDSRALVEHNRAVVDDNPMAG
jgi:hypothetical protein